jgi:hypothetical protein
MEADAEDEGTGDAHRCGDRGAAYATPTRAGRRGTWNCMDGSASGAVRNLLVSDWRSSANAEHAEQRAR